LDLSVIIVNWNSARFLAKCLTSVYANISGLAFEVVVIDNASYDGCAQLIESEFPAVRFIQSDRNLGFGCANNLAARGATGRVLLFLNSDTEIVGSAIQEMTSWVDRLPAAGVVGPRLLNSDGSVQTTCVQAFPSILNQLLATEYLRTTFPKWPLWGNRAVYENSRSPVRVEGIPGASLAIRRDLFELLGGFCSGYFMYGEDMDLCFRASRAGHDSFYIGSASVIHHGGKSSGATSDQHWSAVVMKESIFSFMAAHRGRWYAWAFRSTTAMAAVVRMALVSGRLLLPLADQDRQTLSYAAAKWKRVLRWALGLESWVQQL
jgi:N-acetylglucosaminyl-diphospho-decaprenol L-rhamnosyltransferase